MCEKKIGSTYMVAITAGSYIGDSLTRVECLKCADKYTMTIAFLFIAQKPSKQHDFPRKSVGVCVKKKNIQGL